MAFTVEDAFRETKELYHLNLIAGKEGLANSIIWALQIEDTAIIPHLWGKELAVTMGISFSDPERLYHLIEDLIQHNSSGLIINTGKYISEISDDIIELCNKNHFPLITVPWEILLADLIKDYCIRAFNVENEEHQLSLAFISAIETPGLTFAYRSKLSVSYNVDGIFQVALISSTDTAVVSSIRKRRLLFYMQNALDKTEFTYNLFWYRDSYVLITNDVSEKQFEDFLEDLIEIATIRASNRQIHIGLGTPINQIENLSSGYRRADAALQMSKFRKTPFTKFADMGIYQLLFTVEDTSLLKDFYENTLSAIRAYDQKHNANYEDTLYYYLKFNGSIQAVADALYTHRNTVLYRIRKIKELLGTNLETTTERFPYEVAFCIKEIL